jgi:hypothetical protein
MSETPQSLISPPPKNNSRPRKARAKNPPKNGSDSESKNCLTSVPRNPPPSLAIPRKEYLLKRLNVSPEHLAKSPDLNRFFRENGISIKKAIEAMRFSEDPLIRGFLDKWDTFGDRDHKSLPLHAVALSAGIDAKHLLGEILLAMREHSVNSVKIIAVSAHPEITQKRVEFAKTPGGFRDRDALDEMLGALKPSAGNTFIGKFFAGTTKEMPDNEDQAEELVDDLDYMFPDASMIQDKIQPLRQKALPAK